MVHFNGTKKSETLNGGAGHDFLYGDYGHDWLRGGAGHDTLNGGSGKDTFEGGQGNDTLNLLDGSLNEQEKILFDFTVSGNLGADTAYGFGKDDILDVRGIAKRGIDTIKIDEVHHDAGVYTLVSFFKGGLCGVRQANLRLEGFDAANLAPGTFLMDAKGAADDAVSAALAIHLGSTAPLLGSSGKSL